VGKKVEAHQDEFGAKCLGLRGEGRGFRLWRARGEVVLSGKKGLF